MAKTIRRINEHIERKRVLKGFATSIKSRPYLCCALMLFWTWLNLAYQGPLFFPLLTLESGFRLYSWFTPVAVSALAYFILGVCFKTKNITLRQRWYLPFVAALMMSGALLCFLWMHVYQASLDAVAGVIVYGGGSLTIGWGTALLMVEWGRIFGYLGPREVLFQGIVAMVGSALFVALLSCMPVFVGQLIFVMLPFPLVVCLSCALQKLPRKTLYCHGLNAKLYTPYKFLITAFLHGLSLGVLFGSLFYFEEQANAGLLTALSFVVAAVLLFLTAVFIKMDFNHLIYQMGFSLMATGAFLLACLGGVPLLGVSFQLVGFCYVHLIMWGLCSYLTKNFSLPALWVIAWPTCCLMMGQLMGGVTSSVLIQQADPAFWVQIMATTMVFILLMAALLMLSNRNLTTGWGIARPANLVASHDVVALVAERLTVECNLTPRESEIFILMARGRNRKTISEELVIAEETTKSHVYSMYRKVSLHSQQELLDLVEDMSAEVREDEQLTAFG